MSKNFRLVEYFLSEFYLSKPEDLEHIVSPDFYFQGSTRTKKNFAEYIEQVRLYTSNVNVKIDNIYTADDINFLVKFTFEIVGNTAKYGNKINDLVNITVEDGLIQSAIIAYDALHKNTDKFKAIL